MRIAVALVDEPDRKHFGYDLAQRTGVRSGALYRVLTRLFERGWLSDGWEDLPPGAGRPPRRYYEVTPLGRTSLTEIIDAGRR